MKNLIPLVVVAILVISVKDVFGQCGTTPVTGDLIISSNTTLSGTYNVSGLFRVNSGVVCSVSPYTSGGCGELVINAVDIEILGDIIGDGAGFPGGTGGSGGTTGNNANALNGCVDKDNCLVIDVSGGVAGNAGLGPGAGLAGANGTIGLGPKQECATLGDEYGFVGGAGGAGGAGGGSYGGLGTSGGSGGNGAPYNPGNFSGMDLAGCANPQAGTGGAGGAIGGTYGTTVGTDIDLGSGGAGAGGGGKSAGNGGLGGNGGAGGGLVELNASGSLTVAGNISVNGEAGTSGGVGGNGDVTTDCCNELCNDCGERTFSSGAGGGGGAGGGSGGGILLQSFGPMNLSGTLRSIGGNGSTGGQEGFGDDCSFSGGILDCGLPTNNGGSTGSGTPGELGGAGSGGRIKVFQNPCQTNTINASVLIGGGNGFSGTAADGTYHLGDIGNFSGPSVLTSADSVSCFGLSDGSASITITGGTSPFTISWNDLNSQSTATATNLPAGTYEVTVVDSFGCQVIETVEVQQPDTLTAQIFGIVQADCFGASNGEASVMGMGGTEPYSYLWNDPSLQNTAVATGLGAGTYVVEVTDANGCMAVDSAELTEPQPFAATVSVDQSVSCYGESNGQATVSASGSGLSYLWDTNPVQTTATASNLTAGTWNVTVSSSQTCDTTLAVTITQPDSLVLIAVQNQPVSCNGGSDGVAVVSQLGGTPPYSYQWDDLNLQTTSTANQLPAGVYNVVVLDGNQCSASAAVEIIEPSAISIAVSIDSASCNGSADAQIEAIPSGGTPSYTVEWNPGGVSGNPLTGIGAGSYSVTVTDANGCAGELQNILVPEPSALVLQLVSEEDVSCFGLNDGSAEIGVSGGSAPYGYAWDDPANQTTALASGLSPGVYNVDVTDVNGCMAQWLNVLIEEPDSLNAEVVSSTPITCDYTTDGVAEVQVSGGITPYSYSWDDEDNQTGSTAIDLGAGTYTVTVTDANGCTASAMATIDSPVNDLVADFILSPDSGLQPLDITVTNLSIGGTAYEWLFGDGNTETKFDTVSFQYLYADSGSFDVTLIAYNDVTGCSDTLTLLGGMYVIPTSELLVPNVITPNGDGLNDMFPIDPIANDFFPFKIRNIYDFKGEIYNRWGEKVYEWDSAFGWLGRKDNKWFESQRRDLLLRHYRQRCG